ncbi:MAG TPA: hypothetical protein VEI82_09600 [Myxococcota bacterium]|nr:hypothetical protein [Myxococcota bacterium]
MTRPLTRSLVLSIALAALLAAGGACSRKAAESGAARRPTAAVWTDILAQRDAIHAIMAKDLEDVTHDDCAQLGADSRKLEDLMRELTASVAADKSQTEGHLRALSDALGLVGQTLNAVRESALAEAPGKWVKLRFPLDQSLRTVETYFSADELGGQSVVHRPDFETSPPPEALSPV